MAMAAAPRPSSSRGLPGRDSATNEAANRLIRRIEHSSPEDRRAPLQKAPAASGVAGARLTIPPYCDALNTRCLAGKRTPDQRAWQDRHHAALADRGGIARPRPRRHLRGRAGRGRGHDGRHRACPGPPPGWLRPWRPDEVRAGRGRADRRSPARDNARRPRRGPDRQHRVAEMGDRHVGRPGRRGRPGQPRPATRR